MVLKVQLADDTESLQEAEALRFWDGRGAARLLAHDPGARALLIERCLPGRPLGNTYGDDSLAVAADVMRRLWRPPSGSVPWRQLAVEADRWLDELPDDYERHGRPFERRLLDTGLDALRMLGPTQEGVVLCHQDLHGGNILSAEREPWLAIDVKPIVAERAYDAVAIVRDPGPNGLTLADVRRRLDVLSELLDLDRERIRLWGVAKHLAWAIGGELWAEDVEQVRLMAAA